MTSRHKLAQAGFTLVELAIVLLIVGLLISGILKGQQLIENSRMTATIQQVKSYEAAVNTFRDSFGALPGDMVNAVTRVPGCTGGVGCVNGGNGGTAGDGIVGAANQVGLAATAVGTERTQFWLHMALANLITGITPDFGANTTLAWGTTLPAGRIAGGFLIGQGNAAAGMNGAAAPVNGHYIVLQGTPGNNANGTPVLSPDRAAQMDMKLDDGQPGTGDVVAFGGATCFTAATPAGTYAAVANAASTCSVGVRIMN